MKQRAQKYLRRALKAPAASFRDGQWESIEQLLNKKRVLVVQRTGWGKSMVYFLTTKLLREQGKGVGATLLISPLLALMRNQIEAATNIGITARSINSSNPSYWQQVKQELENNAVDVLLISPERLANDDFRRNILASIAGNVGLFVVDEAHCISDWGHDFRPDYRRIALVLDAIPSNVPVLATTATANDRVVKDVKSQLGKDVALQRGSLVRKSLKLQNINMPKQAVRMAWLAQTVPSLPGSGIIYALTTHDAERVAQWLQKNMINAKPYHAAMNNLMKEDLEQQLLNNKVKALVATVALGMGFDKPDLGFVIHFQRPSSVVHYYQQVGRAGRAVNEAYGVLLCGEEDDQIADYFIRNAFPPQQHIEEILTALDESDSGLSMQEMQKVLNLRESDIEATLKYLTVESPSPIIEENRKWQATSVAPSYRIDQGRVDSITDIRRREQQQMRDYMSHTGCLMAFLQDALDDPGPENCGQCKSCSPGTLLDESCNNILINQAGLFLRRNYQSISPRKMWPAINIFQHYQLAGVGNLYIHNEFLSQPGRALSLWRDAGWGQLVAEGKYDTDRFDDELVDACVTMLKAWSPTPFPEWVTCIPSCTRPELVPDFAERLAQKLKLPFVPCIIKVRNSKPQKEMENSYQKTNNLDGVFSITNQYRNEACLLIDDVVNSRWTLTVATALLRQKGCTAVFPMALALNSLGID